MIAGWLGISTPLYEPAADSGDLCEGKGPLLAVGNTIRTGRSGRGSYAFKESSRSSGYCYPYSRGSGRHGSCLSPISRPARGLGDQNRGDELKPARRPQPGTATQRLGEPEVGTLLLPAKQILWEDPSRCEHAAGGCPPAGLSPCPGQYVSMNTGIASSSAPARDGHMNEYDEAGVSAFHGRQGPVGQVNAGRNIRNDHR